MDRKEIHSETSRAILLKVAALELTYRRNHKCIFCCCPWEADDTYKGSKLSIREWENVVDALMRNGVSTFTLTGCEPLMRDELREIIDMILSRGVKPSLISNERKIDDDFLNFLTERRLAISISILGIETFVEHTGWKTGSFC